MDEEKKKGKNKIIIVLALTLILAAGVGLGFYFILRSANYVVTENARVTATLIHITPTMPGRLERYTIYEGRYVMENEILGWLENGESFRSPLNGIVVRSFAVQDQVVSPLEPLAVIADLNSIHIQANIEETNITQLRRGQPVSVTVDAFGRRQLSGIVSEIGWITNAEITGNSMFFNTGGTFTKVTQIIPVKIDITEDIDLSNLIGLNARVRIPLRPHADGIQPVISRRAADYITTRGTVESTQRRNVYTTLGSMVERVYVEAGDRVTEGQILGILDTQDLQNEANIAQAALRIAEINLMAAEHNNEMLRTLYGNRAISRNELQQSEFQYQAALASRRQAQAALDNARITLERSVIRSPINGTVTAILAREGEIGLGRLFVVEDTGNLKLTTSFREYDLTRIETGMEAFISSDATGDAVYRGIISRINPAAAAFSSVVEFEAEVLVTSPNTGLRIGTNARININLPVVNND